MTEVVVAQELPSVEFLNTHLDIAGRTIFVGDIDEGVADQFIKSMHILKQASSEPITIIINSHGGSLVDAFGMYDCIRTAGTVVTCEVFAHCMSAAVIVVLACDRRLVHTNALTLLHNPSHDISGDSFSIETWGKHAGKTRTMIYKVLAEHTEKPASFWRRKCSKGDYLLDAPDAVKLGIFHSIIEHD